MTLCDLVTVFAETKSVTKSRLHCTYLTTRKDAPFDLNPPLKCDSIEVLALFCGPRPATFPFFLILDGAIWAKSLSKEPK